VASFQCHHTDLACLAVVDCVIFTEDTARITTVPANGNHVAVLPGGGATYRSAPLLKIYKEIERDRLERSWRRDADEVADSSPQSALSLFIFIHHIIWQQKQTTQEQARIRQ